MVALLVKDGERIAGAPEVRPLGPVDLINAELGVVDRIKVALLLEHEARMVLVDGSAVL